MQLSTAVVLVTNLLLTAAVLGQSTEQPSREYKIKAAFLYNFVKFVKWPQDKLGEPNEPVVIGIVGKDRFANAFEPVKNKPIRNRKLVVRQFKHLIIPDDPNEREKQELGRRIETLRRCHVLFLCASEQERLRWILEKLKGASVLTVGESPGFLEKGGIINFLIDDDKVRFEINRCAAKKQHLKISSQLLRLARRTINGDCPGQAQNQPGNPDSPDSKDQEK